MSDTDNELFGDSDDDQREDLLPDVPDEQQDFVKDTGRHQDLPLPDDVDDYARDQEHDEGQREDSDGQIDKRRDDRIIGDPADYLTPWLDCPTSNNLRMVKLTNVLNIASEPFDPDTFEKEDEQYIDENGKTRVNLKHINTIRWRHRMTPEGEMKVESNARFVRWSDGSMQLHLGDEALDIAQFDETKQTNYLFVRHTLIMQGQGRLLKKMQFRPASLNSKLHRRLTSMVDKRHMKGNKVKEAVTLIDPKARSRQLERIEEDRARAREALAKRHQKEQQKFRHTQRGHQSGKMSRDFLEDEEEYDDMDATPVRDRARHDLARSRHVNEEEEAEAERRLTNAKRGAPQRVSRPQPKKSRRDEEEEDEDGDEDEEEEEEEAEEDDEEEPMNDFIANDDEDEEEEDMGAKQKSRGGRRVVNLSDDDDDD